MATKEIPPVEQRRAEVILPSNDVRGSTLRLLRASRRSHQVGADD